MSCMCRATPWTRCGVGSRRANAFKNGVAEVLAINAQVMVLAHP